MPKYTLEIRNPKDPARTCTDMLVFLAKVVAELSVDYGDDGVETGSTLCAAFCPHDMDIHLKDLLAIYIPRKMDGESLGISD